MKQQIVLRRLVTCERCGYEWVARTPQPKRCPRCQVWLPPWNSRPPKGT